MLVRVGKIKGISPKPSWRLSVALSSMLLLCAWSLPVPGQTLDTVTFGNATSESQHGLATSFYSSVTPPALVSATGGKTPSNPSSTAPSQTITGALGLSARQLLPRTPNADVYGGQMSFTMAIDPVQQNYVTVKFWGSDNYVNEWLVLDCNGYEVGSRHGGNNDQEMLWNFNNSWYPDRWVYRTMPLPLNLTRGLTSVTLTIRSEGWLSYYDTAAYFNVYQKLMNSPSPAMYEAATHLGSYFDVSSEPQGTGPSVSTPLPTPTASQAISTIESGVNAQAKSYLSASPSSLTPNDIDYLAEVYGTTWSTYKGSSALISQVIAAIDAGVTAYAAAPSTYMGASWGGYFGPVGDAIRLLWPEIDSGSTMSTAVAYGGSLGTVSRTAGWSAALRASVDSGRFNRQTITNQSIMGGMNIYLANRGLELVQSSNALNEPEALRYVNESCGLSPWLGNDQPGGGAVPVYGTAPFGPNWYMMTTAGTDKEGGFAGSDYGEVGGAIYRMGIVSGNAALQARALVLFQARDYFRYTGTDANNYLIMLGAEPVGVRNDSTMPGHEAYLGRGTSDDFLAASQGASAIGSNLMGYFQQGVNEGQLWPLVESSGYGSQDTDGTQQPLIPDYWTAASAQAQTQVLLPATTGAGLPNFAWADPQNGVVAAKYGTGANEENFYANMYWREPTYTNGMAKLFDLTPSLARVIEAPVQDEQFTSSGITLLGSPQVDSAIPPWDNPVAATGGVPHLEAIRPDLASLPAQNQDGGKANGYTLRWGHWLVGMNAYPASTGTSYAMQMPSDFSSGTDLISGQNFSGQITLQPQTAVVFYMSDSVDPAPPPGRVLYLGAGSGGNGQIPLSWTAAAGASYYTVLRSTTSGGPYSVVANGVTQLQYDDNTAVNGTTYYYVVATSSAAGASGGNSPQASATASAAESSGLPAPWNNADVGSVSPAGSTSYSGGTPYSSGTFTLEGSGADIYGSADAFQFAYIPVQLANGLTITAKVNSQQNTNNNAKAGVMIRQNLTAGSAQVDAIVSPSGGVAATLRGGQNGTVDYFGTGISNAPAPYWVRLSYQAATGITASASPDGVSWTVIGTTDPQSPVGMVYIGLVDSSHKNGTLNTSVFSNVTVTGGTTDSVAAAPAGLAATAGTGQVSLSWNGVTGATGYNLKRSTTSGGPYATLSANQSSTSYVDSSVQGGVTYYYVVSALNATGESPNSAEASAQPAKNTLTVTAQNASRSFETANPPFTYTVAGYVNGDTSAVLSGAPTLSTVAQLNSPAGSYPVVVGLGTLSTASNYSFHLVNAAMTIAGGVAQAITFYPIPGVTLEQSPLILAAHSNSGLPVSYAVTGPATVSGSKITLTGTGTVNVTALQTGNTTFTAAAPVGHSFLVTP